MSTIKTRTKLAFLLIAIVYLVFSFLRPVEDDEATYILAGKAMLEGELDPFEPEYKRNYTNPFMYILGSPLVPAAYGMAYILGGLYLSRLLALLSVLASLFILYKMNQDDIVLILVGLSSSAILLASDTYLDSVALLFMMLSMYHEKNEFLSGLFCGLATITKFILALPLLIYFLRRRKRFIAGALFVLVPFMSAYWRLAPHLIDYVLFSRIGQGEVLTFLVYVRLYLPIILVLYLSRPKRIPDAFPAISIAAYQLITVDFISWPRHLPYIEFSLARFIKAKPLLLLLVPLGVASAALNMAAYPSFSGLDLEKMEGKVLTINPNAYMLIQDLNLRSSAVNVSDYHFFDFNKDGTSEIDEYSMALRRGYFDYALISSKNVSHYSTYDQIQDMVREHYCLFERGNEGVDIYVPCQK